MNPSIPPSTLCPKCDKERASGPECPWCGVLYAKAVRKTEVAEQPPEPEDTFEADREHLRAVAYVRGLLGALAELRRVSPK